MNKFFDFYNKRNVKSFFVVFLTIIAFMIIPLASFFEFTSISIDYNAILRFGIISIISGLIGFGICLILIITLYINPLSRVRVLLLIITELAYILYIFIWSTLGYISIDMDEVYIQFDISLLSLVLIGVPILSILRTIYNYKVKMDEGYRFTIILTLILEGINSKSKLMKYLSPRQDIFKIKNIKINLLLEQLMNQKEPLIKKSGSYSLTFKGKSYLNWIEKHRREIFSQITLISQEKESIPLQIWTEEDLRKYNRGK